MHPCLPSCICAQLCQYASASKQELKSVCRWGRGGGGVLATPPIIHSLFDSIPLTSFNAVSYTKSFPTSMNSAAFVSYKTSLRSTLHLTRMEHVSVLSAKDSKYTCFDCCFNSNINKTYLSTADNNKVIMYASLLM